MYKHTVLFILALVTFASFSMEKPYRKRPRNIHHAAEDDAETLFFQVEGIPEWRDYKDKMTSLPPQNRFSWNAAKMCVYMSYFCPDKEKRTETKNKKILKRYYDQIVLRVHTKKIEINEAWEFITKSKSIEAQKIRGLILGKKTLVGIQDWDDEIAPINKWVRGNLEGGIKLLAGK